ncbi:MAG: M23 family metallopeptidase [Nitrospirales bacterium]|nr:M23 family metallopeptidase [Nitrospirales bacterium]
MISQPSRTQSSSSWYTGRKLFILCLLIASIFPIQIVPSAERQRPGADGQFSGKQGEILWVEVPVSDSQADVKGIFLKRKIPFFRLNEHAFAGLVGIDMEDPQGEQELSVQVHSEGGTQHFSYAILIIKENYTIQELTLPKNKVDLDSKTLKRVKAEQQELAGAFHRISDSPLWDGPFLEPVAGKITGVFGSRRVINGQPRRPHTGEDIAAPTGTPVLAINTGTVVLAVDHFFSGKGIILDHGLGLFSMYFHLSEIDVQHGQSVQKGEAIGKVGASGRATGPHLHWGIRLNGSRVNPFALTSLPFKG